MLIQQAIFTSLRRTRLSGYQLAATSPGMTSTEAQELSAWGPTHDSLMDPHECAESINFHRLESGPFCVSRTVPAGPEYSGRGGHRIYTQFCTISPRDFSSFDNHPLSLWEAISACGGIQVHAEIPGQLEPVRLLTPPGPQEGTRLAQLIDQLGSHSLSALITAAVCTGKLGVVSPLPGDVLLAGLFDALPPNYRSGLSFTTGLKYSPRRSYRIMLLPRDRMLQRRMARMPDFTVLDLTAPHALADHRSNAWATLVVDTFHIGRHHLLAELLRAVRSGPVVDLEQMSQQLRHQFRIPHACAVG